MKKKRISWRSLTDDYAVDLRVLGRVLKIHTDPSTYCNVLNCAVVKHVHLGPGCTGQIFVYFGKKSVTTSPRQVRPVIFRSTQFCQDLPNFKDAVVLPQSRTNFCQAWNLTYLLIYTPWFEGNCQSRKFALCFLFGVFQSEAHKNYLIFARQSNSEDEVATAPAGVEVERIHFKEEKN